MHFVDEQFYYLLYKWWLFLILMAICYICILSYTTVHVREAKYGCVLMYWLVNIPLYLITNDYNVPTYEPDQSHYHIPRKLYSRHTGTYIIAHIRAHFTMVDVDCYSRSLLI